MPSSSQALLRLSLYSIFSKSSGCALFLSFHIELNDRCVFAYPSWSALSLCEQPLFSMFSAFIGHSLLSTVILGTPTDSVLHLSAIMTSADFCMFNSALQQRLLLSEHSTQTSPGTHTFFLSIYLLHLPCMIPCSYWASACLTVLPS